MLEPNSSQNWGYVRYLFVLYLAIPFMGMIKEANRHKIKQIVLGNFQSYSGKCRNKFISTILEYERQVISYGGKHLFLMVDLYSYHFTQSVPFNGVYK